MGTPKEFFENTVAERLKSNPAEAKQINAVYQFELSGEGGGTWVVDLKSDPPSVKAGPSPDAQCTISMSAQDFMAVVEGKLNAQMAFMQGKLKIKGDMGLAMKLNKILKT